MKRFVTWSLLGLAAVSAGWWIYSPFRAQVNALLPPSIVALLPVPGPTEPASPKAEPKRKGPPPAPVTVATVTSADMPVIISAPGTVESAASVAMKPRVDGQIAEIAFKEGDLVKAGQLLFRLDDRLIKAQIRQAEATIKKDEASLADAQATFNRRDSLVQKKIVSEAAMDTAKATVETLKASIAAGQAALEAQKTQLDYLRIVAPITGRTGSVNVKEGSNIRAADTAPLVVINQTQPISVSFAVPQIEIAALRRALATQASADIQPPSSPGRSAEKRTGTIVFLDNQVDKTTGTVTAKIEYPNADEYLWPGQAVEVALTVERQKGRLSVPASAVQPSQQGMIAWVVGPENKVEPRPVVLDRIIGQTAFVSEGLKEGETVVTDGQLRIAPGATVTITGDGQQRPPQKKGEPKAEGKGGNGKGDKRS